MLSIFAVAPGSHVIDVEGGLLPGLGDPAILTTIAGAVANPTLQGMECGRWS